MLRWISSWIDNKFLGSSEAARQGEVVPPVWSYSHSWLLRCVEATRLLWSATKSGVTGVLPLCAGHRQVGS